MRTRLKHIQAVLLRRARYKVTKGGMLFTLGVLLVALGAIVSANNLLFLILATMLATILVSGFISRLCLAGLELDLILPEHVSACRTLRARLYVRNLKRWIPSFSIHVGSLAGQPNAAPVLTTVIYFPVIPGGAVLEESVEVLFPKRGAYQENSFTFSTRFPFGFLEKSARVILRREVVVYPSVDPQPGFEELVATVSGEIETHFKGLGKDFYRIRPYQAFESARHVDWKATAHTGDLQVREFAREQDRAVELFLDREVPEPLEPWFERAIDCCAFLVWRLSLQGADIRFRSQEFQFRLPEDGDVYTILRYLALVGPEKGVRAESPADETSFQIVLSAAPHRFTELGWIQARLLGPDAFCGDPDGAATGRAS